MATRRTQIMERYNQLTEEIATSEAALTRMKAELNGLSQELKDTPADILDNDATADKNAYLKMHGLLK